MKHCCVLFALIILMFSCSDQSELENKVLIVENSICDISDSVFLSKVKNLAIHDSKLYFIDSRLDQVISLNQDFTLNLIIGEKGEGPSEFMSLTGFCITDSTIYILNGGHAELCYYNLSGELIGEYKFNKDNSFIMPEYRFMIQKDSSLIIASTSKEGAFMEIDLKSDNYSFLGERSRFDIGVQERIRNGRHVFCLENKVIGVSDNIPIIDVSSIDDGKKNSYDYSEIKDVKKLLELIDEMMLSNNSYQIICQDAYVDNQSLYILLAEKNENNFITNKIIEFELFPVIREKSQITLPGNNYSTFCVSGGDFYAFNQLESKIEHLKYKKD